MEGNSTEWSFVIWYNIAEALPVGDGNQRAKIWLTLTKTSQWVKKQVSWLESHSGHYELIWVPSENYGWFCSAFNVMLFVWAVQHINSWLNQWCMFWGWECVCLGISKELTSFVWTLPNQMALAFDAASGAVLGKLRLGNLSLRKHFSQIKCQNSPCSIKTYG